ncbi:hydrolase 1, exosortase A system-associated [Pseudomaricurvus alkylphenolicus]|uniref:hydrolase 1, exosortase A system-associated n=1 Tax=Pseudomaricurvus alkylphenolicus TaxID=1306991 RepID=UPI00141FE77C|nr:hydrolase 1, exosortase A system-associated [Pseudomaricurvus alkylphenolicus]NIB43096.1 hydrolase 1, exosortase A system-associated [Pseudomaricurvus alkylphenolicus]
MNSACLQKAVTFDCEGDRLVGVLHLPQEAKDWGVITVVAGGPQYRAGCGRQLLLMGRELAAQGIPVMRFDQRGVGDSEGDFLGFHRMTEEYRAAVKAFKEHAPSVRHIALWGGCDAAASALIHGWKIDGIDGLMLANPFLTYPSSRANLQRKHYLKRLGERSFWKKVLTLQYNPLEYAGALLGRPTAKPKSVTSPAGDGDQQLVHVPEDFGDHMLKGLNQFQGQVLFVMSEHSPTRREFDEIIADHPGWGKAYRDCNAKRVDLPEADQTFSTEGSRAAASEAALEWLNLLCAKQ